MKIWGLKPDEYWIVPVALIIAATILLFIAFFPNSDPILEVKNTSQQNISAIEDSDNNEYTAEELRDYSLDTDNLFEMDLNLSI